MPLVRHLTQPQERRLNRLYMVGDLGAGRWETVKNLLARALIVERAGRIVLTPAGRLYCETFGPQLPV